MKTQKSLFFSILILILYFPTVDAQKLPQVQDVSVRAPVNIKIDGKLNEWPIKSLYAYNSTNRIYYVVSNDDDNLYLTIRGLGTRVSVKALQGGLIFTISSAVNKKDRNKSSDNPTITFPVPIDVKTANYIMGPERSLRNFIQDSALYHKEIDSTVNIANNRLKQTLKQIKVTGFKEMADATIPTDNSEGIRVSFLFQNVEPIIEMAIPLKFLGISISNLTSFSYNIKLVHQADDPVPLSMVNNVHEIVTTNPDDLYLQNTTDFWGEYTLAKKP